MTYLLIHNGALATAHARGGVIHAAEAGALRSAAELLQVAEALSSGIAAQAAAAREAASAAGFAAGLAEGRAAAAAEHGAALTRLAAETAGEHQRLRAETGALALEVVRRIAGEVGPEAIVSGLAVTALDRLLPDAAVIVRVPHAAATAVEARLRGRFEATIIGDADLAPTDCIIKTGEGRVQAGLETQLAALERAWDISDAR